MSLAKMLEMRTARVEEISEALKKGVLQIQKMEADLKQAYSSYSALMGHNAEAEKTLQEVRDLMAASDTETQEPEETAA